MSHKICLVIAGHFKVGKPMLYCFSFKLNQNYFVRSIYYYICVLFFFFFLNCRKCSNWERKCNFKLNLALFSAYWSCNYTINVNTTLLWQHTTCKTSTRRYPGTLLLIIFTNMVLIMIMKCDIYWEVKSPTIPNLNYHAVLVQRNI